MFGYSPRRRPRLFGLTGLTGFVQLVQLVLLILVGLLVPLLVRGIRLGDPRIRDRWFLGFWGGCSALEFLPGLLLPRRRLDQDGGRLLLRTGLEWILIARLGTGNQFLEKTIH